MDQGTPLLIKSLLKLGANRRRLIAQLCGGARALFTPDLKQNALNIGQRNVQAAESALRAEGLGILAQDTGGDIGRTVKFYIDNGLVIIQNSQKRDQAPRVRRKI